MSNDNSNNDLSPFSKATFNEILFQAILLFYKSQIDGRILDIDNFKVEENTKFEPVQIGNFKFYYETQYLLTIPEAKGEEDFTPENYKEEKNKFLIQFGKKVVLNTPSNSYYDGLKEYLTAENRLFTIYRFLIHPIFLNDPKCKITFVNNEQEKIWEYKENIVEFEKELYLDYLKLSFDKIDNLNLIEVNEILKKLKLDPVFTLNAGKEILKTYIPPEISNLNFINLVSDERIDNMNNEELLKSVQKMRINLVKPNDNKEMKDKIKIAIKYFKDSFKIKFPENENVAKMMKKEDYGMLTDKEIKKMKNLKDATIIYAILDVFETEYQRGNDPVTLRKLKKATVTKILGARNRNYFRNGMNVDGNYEKEKKEILFEQIKFGLSKHWPVIENNVSWMKIFNRLKLHPENTEMPLSEKYERCLTNIGVLFDHLDKMEPVPLGIYKECLEDTEGL